MEMLEKRTADVPNKGHIGCLGTGYVSIGPGLLDFEFRDQFGKVGGKL